MKWLARIGIVGLCIFLWFGLWQSSAYIAEIAKQEHNKKPFQFPGLLPDSEVYVWSLSQGLDDTVALLLVQNIGQYPKGKVELVFSADGKKLYFEIENMPFGQKVFVREKYGAMFEDWNTVACISYTATEQTGTSFRCDEDYGCKK